MALVGMSEAAKLTGKNPATIHKAMAAGRLSYSINDKNERMIDTSELDRVFPILYPDGKPAPPPAVKAASKKATEKGNSAGNSKQWAEMLAELRILQERVEHLKDKTAALEERNRDLKKDRDDWKQQAQTLLLKAPEPQAAAPSAYIQPQPAAATLDFMTETAQAIQQQPEETRRGFWSRLFGRGAA